MSLSSGFSSTGRSTGSPLTVTLHRGSIAESRHRVHAVVCDGRGRVLMAAGDPGHETFIRSALKPFQALPFISSGAAAQMDVGDRGLAISSASHCWSTLHAREAQTALERRPRRQPPAVSGSVLGRQPAPAQLLGIRAAFLATCRKIGWPLENYLQQTIRFSRKSGARRRTAWPAGQELVAAGMTAERQRCACSWLRWPCCLPSVRCTRNWNRSPARCCPA